MSLNECRVPSARNLPAQDDNLPNLLDRLRPMNSGGGVGVIAGPIAQVCGHFSGHIVK